MTGDVPAGYHTVTPYLTAPDADQLIEFLTSVLDGDVIKEDRYENGRVQHARVRLGDSVIMLNEATAEYSPNDSQLHLYVTDVDRSFERALAAGATKLMAPNQRPHGDRMAGIRDPCGNTWWLASPA